jgi:perosamine synthetase
MIPLFKVHMPKTTHKKLAETIYSGFIGQGPKVEQFEKKLKTFFKNKNILTLNSGTSAIQLALRLCKVTHNDEVITTPMTCTATNMPLLAMGAKIVWADVDPITGLIDPVSIEKKITKKTKAIIMVHFGGIPCKIDEINKIAKKYKIKVIEDAAHALGSKYKNKLIGNHSDFVTFSLQAIKHITTGDGGILICKKYKDYQRGKLLRWYGIDRDEKKRKDFRCEKNIIEYGYKFHMNDICATIGLEQMKYIKTIINKHINNSKYYDKKLINLKNIKLIPKNKNIISSSWIYTLHIQNNRDYFIKWMAKNGIVASRVHERNDIHSAFKASKTKLKNLNKFNSTQVSIPVGWWLKKNQLKYIVQKIKNYKQK